MTTCVVVRIMRRRHLDRPGSQLRVHEQTVGDDGNLPIHERYRDHLADQVLIARIIGMDGHRGVAKHGFRPGRRKADEFTGTFDRISERPEAAFNSLVIHFVIRDGGLQLRVPVDQPLAAENQAGAEKVEKRLPHGPSADGIEREASSRPIAATAQLAQLPQDSGLILVLPLPDALDQLIAA